MYKSYVKKTQTIDMAASGCKLKKGEIDEVFNKRRKF